MNSSASSYLLSSISGPQIVLVYHVGLVEHHSLPRSEEQDESNPSIIPLQNAHIWSRDSQEGESAGGGFGGP